MSGSTVIIVIAVIAGGFWLVRRAQSFRSGLVILLCVLVLLGLVVGSHP